MKATRLASGNSRREFLDSLLEMVGFLVRTPPVFFFVELEDEELGGIARRTTGQEKF